MTAALVEPVFKLVGLEASVALAASGARGMSKGSAAETRRGWNRVRSRITETVAVPLSCVSHQRFSPLSSIRIMRPGRVKDDVFTRQDLNLGW